jgi:hypothetical protein
MNLSKVVLQVLKHLYINFHKASLSGHKIMNFFIKYRMRMDFYLPDKI